VTYSPFGFAVFGTDLFGAPPSLSISSVLTVTPVGYSSLQITWTPPNGAYTQLILMRSAFGTPISIFDNQGTVLLSETAAQGFSAQFLDTGLVSGHFYYYALFVVVVEQATPQLLNVPLLAGAAQGLVLTDWGFGDTFQSWTPDWYLEQDLALGTSDQPEGPLVRLLQLIGYEMDWIRSEIESLFLFTNIEQVSGALLPALGANYGIEYEPELGMTRSRVLVQNAVYLYKHRGTTSGIEAAASAFSGYGCTLSMGPNLEIQLDDSAFDRSVGHWVPLNVQSTITLAAASTYAVIPPHTAYVPMLVDALTSVEGYLPINNENVALITATGAAFGVSTCTSANAQTLGIPIPQGVSPPSFVLSAYFYPLSATLRSFQMRIDWYAQNGAFLSSTTGAAVAEVGFTWVRAYVVGTPPVGAYTFGRTVLSTASMGGDLHLMDAEQVETNTQATPGPSAWQPPRDIQLKLYPIRQNLVSNPTGQGGLTGWTVSGGTLAVATSGVSWPVETTQGFALTSSSTVPMVLSTSGSVVGGLAYSFSCYFQAATTSRSILLTVEFFDNTGTVISSTTTTFNDIPAVFTQGANIGVVAPGNAITVTAVITVQSSSAHEVHYFGAPLLAPEAALLPYFDATFVPSTDYLFEGTPNQSVSDYYPALLVRLSRLAAVLPDFIPIGSTFSLLVGSGAALQPLVGAGTFYDWDDSADIWDNITDTWG
jgi:hypothetical protein